MDDPFINDREAQPMKRSLLDVQTLDRGYKCDEGTDFRGRISSREKNRNSFTVTAIKKRPEFDKVQI